MPEILLPPASEGDILLIVPPFAGVERPSLGCHLLQAIGRAQGARIDVLYANLALAAMDCGTYLAVGEAGPLELGGERVFAQAAYGRSTGPVVVDNQGDSALDRERAVRVHQTIAAMEGHVGPYLEALEAWINRSRYRAYGLSTTFDQNLASICLARCIRRQKPHALILFGGANCEGEMGKALADLVPEIDHVFGGESEATFEAFVRDLIAGAPSAPRVVSGRPCHSMDALPLPDYAEYFAQRASYGAALDAAPEAVVPYETSRGCWWGERSHCTFCGLNGEGMGFRHRSPARALADIRSLDAQWDGKTLTMADNIMPLRYFKDLLPALAQGESTPSIFYEQKSNLKRHEIQLLKASGVVSIQPGIESLATPLLKRMKKGVAGVQNVRLLKWCRLYDISVLWNLLYGFPDEEEVAFEQMATLVPKLHHLPPPETLSKVNFSRFSPYFEQAEDFGVRNLRPSPAYAACYPETADLARIAYHFEGDADTIDRRRPDLLAELSGQVRAWRGKWTAAPVPVLAVLRDATGRYFIADNRAGGKPGVEGLEATDAWRVVTETRERDAFVDEALGRGWMVEMDGVFLGVASAVPAVFDRLAADVSMSSEADMPVNAVA
jgi:ribosomal peptide maturation radical SAM protein 1